MPLRRKKWSEEEERTLIDKYAVMLADGTLSKLKTREKRFKPIAAYVDMMHHERDPVAFPWQWTWKDVSTKVQNMRHQYLGVKQKIKKSVVAPEQSGGAAPGGDPGHEDYDWVEGLSRWSNFLRYKDVFGDVVSEADDSFSGEDPRGCSGMGDGIRPLASSHMDALGSSLDADLLRDGIRGIDGGSDLLGLALESDYDGEDGDDENQLKEDGDAFEFENSEAAEVGKKRKRLVKNGRMVEQRLWEFLVNQIAQLREREARLEGRHYEREKREQFRGAEGKRRLEGREKGRGQRDQNWERSSQERVRDWGTMEMESAERERRRREEDMLKEREWEEKLEKRREEWKKRMDDMLRQHRAEMEQLQARIMQDQQNVMNQLLGLLSQWTGHSTGLHDHTSAGNPYLSQMVQNLHHVNGIVPGESRIDGDNHDDHFIVDA
uniref:Uncharacterized protein n=1 Tax=Nymphaea colorata TaxID=210225 RepID=A0A5K1B9K7_9MAGN